MKRLAILLFAVRCACPDEEPVAVVRAHVPAAPVAQPAARVQAAPPPALVPPRVSRNPFAYVAPRPAVQVARPLAAAPAPLPVAQPEPQRAGAAPQPPHFPWRYIGRFGPAHDPIAAFVRDAEVRTVRAGERIDEQFVLRTIGLESVQIEANGWPERIVMALSDA